MESSLRSLFEEYSSGGDEFELNLMKGSRMTLKAIVDIFNQLDLVHLN